MAMSSTFCVTQKAVWEEERETYYKTEREKHVPTARERMPRPP